ncbi:phosphate ABC transporter substrate-binding protein, PhoT family [Marinobacter persicus]|uniref:Phosphate ABC transporter substrate-binding protein, PhoT family n=2 Tax=Marinobacter persicus TaxID=930118 RepID=A0A1I3QWF7_9GAMM|nr:membrane protein [Marinobacter persicus]SFJ37631.1 phosphate ABC transporter substrate-binding protein, PhoT family [Marinobacter persicus]
MMPAIKQYNTGIKDMICTHARKLVSRTAAFITVVSLSMAAAAHDLEIHGSNTVGATLAPMLVTGYLQQLGEGDVRTRGTGTVNEKILSTRAGDRDISILVAAHGSSTGYRALASNEADIWASSRPAKASEVEQLGNRADLRSLDSEHVIAIDGLAILVHPQNPVNKLSIDQLGQIFSGQINNWAQLGGADQPIRLYARDNRSGTWDTFKSLVLNGEYSLHESARRYESNDKLSDDVSRDPAGIGFAGLASVRNSKLLAVSDGNAPAMKPDQLTVASEDYPLSRRLYMYTTGEQAPAMARELIDFALSSEGQALVAESGFVSQNPLAVKPDFEAVVPDSFRKLTERYQRLTVNFRFAEGRTKLDNKALRDLLRLKHYLAEQNRQARDLLLIGFADAQQHELKSQMVSELRAISVRKALNEIGVENAPYTGYGHYMPVSGKGSPRNGRVEVWIKNR